MTLPKDHFSHEEMSLLFRLEDGCLFWRPGFGRRKAGQLAGTINKHGYRAIKVNGKLILAHRIVWLLQTGHWPRQAIDHINRVKDDNRFENHRLADGTQNQANKPQRAGLAFKGVQSIKNGKFVACCVRRHVGTFKTAEEAAKAYDKRATELFGKFAYLNFPE